MAIGFFTQGVIFTLPHPPIPKRTILLICEVIKEAWHILEKYPPRNFCLDSAQEDTITQILVEIIENRLRKNGEIDGFDKLRFGKVTREPKIPNVNKEHPDKMPDIFFDLKRSKYSVLSDQDGLFVECKPIDRKHPVSSCYCGKGLIRFVNGDYAWAMQDGLMVGYADKCSSFKKLASTLNGGKKASLKTNAHFMIEHSIYHSRHERDFEWPENRGQACPISIAHLWLPIEACS